MKKLFTLIELIAVIIVIGILAVIVIPNVSSMKKESTETALRSNVRNMQTAVDRYALNNSSNLPTSAAPEIGMPKPIDLEMITPDYLRTKPKIEGAKYWVDSTGKVWASFVDSPTGVTHNKIDTLVWDNVEGAVAYNIFKTEQKNIQGSTYKGEASHEFIQRFEPKDVVEKYELKLSALPEGEVYLVNAIDYQGNESPPVTSSYRGYQEEFTEVPLNLPVAVITMTPNTEIKTTTTIQWSHSESNSPIGLPILEAEWENKQDRYTTKGEKTVRLRVKDERGVWSKWVEQTFMVSPINNMDGSGTVDDPYIIKTPQDLSDVRNDMTAHYKIVNNLDLLTLGYWNPIGQETVWNDQFKGTIDGGNYTIFNFKINSPTMRNAGLVRRLSKEGVIKNIVFSNVNLNVGTVSGTVVATNSGLIENIKVTGTIQSTQPEIAGITATNYGTVSKTSFRGTVSSTGSRIGGIVGIQNGGKTELSSNSGTVKGASAVGGIMGYSVGVSQILNTYSTATVSGNTEIGGIAGWSGVGGNSVIKYSYATGDISGIHSVGGVLGRTGNQEYESHEVAYNFGLNNKIIKTNSENWPWFGRVAGLQRKVSFHHNYANSSMQFINPYGSFVANINDKDGANITLASAKLKSSYTSVGWDFNNIWTINEGSGYPTLRWESN